jgi:hypothetical protein
VRGTVNLQPHTKSFSIKNLSLDTPQKDLSKRENHNSPR